MENNSTQPKKLMAVGVNGTGTKAYIIEDDYIALAKELIAYAGLVDKGIKLIYTNAGRDKVYYVSIVTPTSIILMHMNKNHKIIISKDEGIRLPDPEKSHVTAVINTSGEVLYIQECKYTGNE